MCALQMQAEAGPTLADNPDALEAGIEKYIVKQVPFSCTRLHTRRSQPSATQMGSKAHQRMRGSPSCGRCMSSRSARVQVLMTRPREEWRQDVAARYRALEQFSKEDSRLQFLRILRSMPYGALHGAAF